MSKRKPELAQIIAIRDDLHDTGDLNCYDLVRWSPESSDFYWRNLHGLSDVPTVENRFSSIEAAIVFVVNIGFTVFERRLRV